MFLVLGLCSGNVPLTTHSFPPSDDDFLCVLKNRCGTIQMSVVLRRQTGKKFLFQSYSACSFPLKLD